MNRSIRSNSAMMTPLNSFYLHQARKGWRAGLLLVLLMQAAPIPVAVAATRPQQPQAGSKPDSQDQPIRLKTALVEVHAVVTDKQGNLVTGLTQNDFEVVENGHNQVVSFFSAEDLRKANNTAATPKPVTNNNALSNHSDTTPPRRTIVFFVDTLHLETLSLMRLKEIMLKFIDERMGDDDIAAVVTTTGGLGTFSQFTRDKQVLRVAVNRLSASPPPWQGSFLTPYLAARMIKEAPAAPEGSGTLAEQMRPLPPPVQTAMNIVKAEDSLPDVYDTILHHTLGKSTETLAMAANRRRVTLLTLKAVAGQMADLPGQRFVFLFSDGFTMYDEGAVEDTDDLRAVVSRASRSGIVVDTIAAKGLTGPSMYDAGGNGKFTPDLPGARNIPSLSLASDRELEHGMERIAAGTGGEAYLTTNDLSGAMVKALDTNSYYYALGYYPANLDEKNKTDFRIIKVRVKGHSDYTVRTQSGYFVGDLLKAKEPPPADPMKALLGAMGEPLAATGVNVAMTADFFYLPNDPSQVSVTVYIDASKLGSKSEGDSFVHNLTMLTGTLSSGGGTLGVLKDDIHIKLNKKQLAQSQSQQSMYRYTKRLTLKPGTYQIRVGVRDEESGQVGTASAWVEVPEMKPKKLILSGMILERGQPGSEGEESLVGPPEVRNGIAVFRQHDEVRYREWAYQAGLEGRSADEVGGAALIKTEVVADEKMVIAGDWRPLSSVVLSRATGGIEFGEQLKGGRLKPGYYTLRVTVKAGPQAKEEIMRETMLQVVR